MGCFGVFLRFVLYKYKSDAKECESPAWPRIWAGQELRGWAGVEGLPLQELRAPNPRVRELSSCHGGEWAGAAAQGLFFSSPQWSWAGLKGPNPSFWTRTYIQDQSLLSGRDLTLTIHIFYPIKGQAKKKQCWEVPTRAYPAHSLALAVPIG